MDQSIAAADRPRQGDWMITFSGRRFYPLDPHVDDICIEDIAHHLSLICRFGGAVEDYYSVAEHSCHLADYFSRKDLLSDARSALMHDASETYLGDMIRPIKPYLAQFLTIEDAVELAIGRKFGLQHPLPAVVKEADSAIIGDERVQLFAPEALRAYAWKLGPGLGITLHRWAPVEAERQFLLRFRALFPEFAP